MWDFPTIIFLAVYFGFSREFFAVIFILMACEIMRWEAELPLALAILHIHGILFAVFMEKGELIALLAIVFANDCAALFSGKIFGGKFFSRRPVPKISPNKTFEGYIGGLLVSAAVAVGMFSPHLFFSSVFLALAGNTGDLLNSFVKRKCGVKDSGENFFTGKMFCGHGGAYDRFDSVSLAIPAWLALNILFF